MIAQRNNGKFPTMHVRGIVTFGPGTRAHGDLDMPTWGRYFARGLAEWIPMDWMNYESLT